MKAAIIGGGAPKLSAYNPTLRDRAATSVLGMLGNPNPNSPLGQLVSGILGSTGAGGMGNNILGGNGLIDLTPFGVPFMADEAGRQMASGHPLAGAASLAMALPLPVGKAAQAAKGLIGSAGRKAVAEAAQTAVSDAGKAAAPVLAYHGSPTSGLTALKPGERGPFGAATYLTPNRGYAERYAGPAGNVYEAQVGNVFDGMHWPSDSSVNPYDVWRNQTAKLVDAAAPEHKQAIADLAAKLQPRDGYPLFSRIAQMHGSNEAAQDLFRRAGFDGVAGHVDGPEIAMFGDVPLKQAAPPPIIAYHGSPHAFDKFDTAKIGTGEGAQAYGHGLYFAENENTAQAYRKVLSKARPDFDGKIAPDLLAALNKVDYLGFGSPGEALTAIRQHADWVPRWDVSPDEEAMLRPLIDAHETRKYGGQGHTYQVGINAHPDHFLDWDKPLSEQHPAVQEAVAGIDHPLIQGWQESGAFPHVRGETLYRQLSGGLTNGAAAKGLPVGASETLQQAGIPGIKYLDQGSRTAGDGTRNYVVFNPEHIDILKRYGIPATVFGTAGAAAAASGVGQQQDDGASGL
jgi:hypothetical protein